MPFLNGFELDRIYKKAKREGYGFMASNFVEPNVLIGLLEASDNKKSDLVLQLSTGACKFAGGGDIITGLRTMSKYIEILAKKYDIGVFLNLDHWKKKDLELIKIAVKEKLASSIMIDASLEAFDENVRITHEVVKMAHEKGILIEGELGKIKGVEDEDTASDEAFYTDPGEAVEFVEKTGIDLLAISIGTQHGVSKGRNIELRTDLAQKINDALIDANKEAPLVLHGSSGLLEEQVKEIIKYGICKLNKDTRYQYEYARTALDFYIEHKYSILPPEGVPDDRDGFFSESEWSPSKADFDPRSVSKLIREQIKKTAEKLIAQAGSDGKSLYMQ
ncbi:class II fructose-bisphosphate aldolase [candidate division WOR-3 bacterium]|nr:class II fructose-bisphosphate aldolase [candidate division WOR-3 bacterium]